MKIKLEPERFKRLLEAGMILKSKSLIDPLIIKFNPKGAIIEGVYSDMIAIHYKLDKKFFLSFESDEENVAIPSVLLDKLGWGFKDTEIEIFTEDNSIFLKGKIDSYDVDLEDSEPKPFNFVFKEVEGGEVWEKMNMNSAVKIDAKELKLPPGESYYFEYKDKKLSVKIPGTGNFVRQINLKETIGEEDIKFGLNSEYYNSIVDNLEGDILLVMDGDRVLFSEKRKDYIKTYVFSVLSE